MVHAFIRRHATPSTVIAIDAPLMIPNPTGQRACETEVGSRYGARDASCHTSNQRLYPGAASVALASALVADGYVHVKGEPDDSKLLLEVYPHAAMVALFDLPKIIKYKKGPVSKRREGLQCLSDHIRSLSHAEPPLVMGSALNEILSCDLSALPARRLKMHEDRLDAIFCAYLAYYFWCWRLERNEVFGDVQSGYIINPRLVQGGIVQHAA